MLIVTRVIDTDSVYWQIIYGLYANLTSPPTSVCRSVGYVAENLSTLNASVIKYNYRQVCIYNNLQLVRHTVRCIIVSCIIEYFTFR